MDWKQALLEDVGLSKFSQAEEIINQQFGEENAIHKGYYAHVNFALTKIFIPSDKTKKLFEKIVKETEDIVKITIYQSGDIKIEAPTIGTRSMYSQDLNTAVGLITEIRFDQLTKAKKIFNDEYERQLRTKIKKGYIEVLRRRKRETDFYAGRKHPAGIGNQW